MKTNAIIRELRGKDNNIFRALNHVFGFDFESRFHVLRLESPFTINKINKVIETKGYTTADSCVVVLTMGGRRCFSEKLTGFKITGAGNSDFTVNNIRDNRRWCHFKTLLDDTWCKGDFNDIRKNPETKAYIIVQKKADLAGLLEEKRPDFTDSFLRLTEEGQKAYTGRTHNYGRYTSARELVFDKSGYELSYKRDNLKRRAENLRKERAAADFAATDNTAIIEALRERLTALKASFADQLLAATTSDEVKRIAESLRWFHGLSGVFDDFERLEEGEKKKSFSSIGAFNMSLAEINAQIKELAS